MGHQWAHIACIVIVLFGRAGALAGFLTQRTVKHALRSFSFRAYGTKNKITSSAKIEDDKVRVAVTREQGENCRLVDLLSGLHCIEIPCITFANTAEADLLPTQLCKHATTILTSPQAASVYLQAWQTAGAPAVQVATVGRGTSLPLLKHGVTPVFEPTQATGEALARELPLTYGPRLLYPSSALADNKIVHDLESRGFEVLRLNTYTTIPTCWTPETVQQARAVDIVTFASPSAVKNWAIHVGTLAVAVVIGPTTAEAARKAGFQEVYSPTEGSKGVESWAALVREVAKQF